MSSSDTISINNLNTISLCIYKYIIPIFYIIGNLGNFLSILIFSKKSWKKNVCVFYFNIYILISTFYLNSTVLASIFTNGYDINIQNSNLILCKVYLYVSFLFATLAPTILLLASIDRLLISSQNVDTRLYSSKRLAYFLISISTIFWLIFYCHLLIKGNIQEYYPTIFICAYELTKIYLYFISYSLMVINVLFCFLMILLSIIAFKNVRFIRMIPRQQQRNQIRSMTKKDFQLLRCLFAKDISYIVFSIPVATYYVYSATTQDQIQTQLQQAILVFYRNLSTCLYNISVTISFGIFMAISKAFRQEFKRMIYKIFGKDFNGLREEDKRDEHVNMKNTVSVVSTIGL